MRHLPAGPPPANETQPQKKLLSSFIAAPTTAAASASLPQLGEAAVSCSFSNLKAFIGKHYAAEQELGKQPPQSLSPVYCYSLIVDSFLGIYQEID